jgi:hypothetical protein
VPDVNSHAMRIVIDPRHLTPVVNEIAMALGE